MHIEILVFKETGKYYSSNECSSEDNIMLFEDEFMKFVYNNLPCILCNGWYIVTRDVYDDTNNDQFHTHMFMASDFDIYKCK